MGKNTPKPNLTGSYRNVAINWFSNREVLPGKTNI
jgi:hypothetical protein